MQNATTPVDSTAGTAVGSEPAAAPPGPPAPTSPGVDANGLRSYRLALAREARRYKRYPAQAIEAGWTGTVELRVSVTSGQGAPMALLTKSSGHPLLDEAALEMLNRALPATPVPASLRERDFSVDLPFVFDLPQ